MDKTKTIELLADKLTSKGNATYRPFILFAGPSGSGKTYCANLLAELLGYDIVTRLTDANTNNDDSIVIVLDEAQGLKKAEQEKLLALMNDIEDRRGAFIAYNNKGIPIARKKVVLILCTTNRAQILEPIKNRCIPVEFKAYEAEDIRDIILCTYSSIKPEIADSLSRVCKLNVRFALQMADFVQNSNMTVPDVLVMFGLDRNGLSETDLDYIRILGVNGPCSVQTIASVLSAVDTREIEQVTEVYLKRAGFIEIRGKGRILTQRGKKLYNDLNEEAIRRL